MEYYQYHFGPVNIRHEIMVSKYSFSSLKIFFFQNIPLFKVENGHFIEFLEKKTLIF